ncbi:Aldehyde/histidinol dehydrogenase [Schizophyllum commune]
MTALEYTPIEDIDKIHAQLQAGFKSGKTRSLAYRKYLLLQLGYLIQENRTRFADSIHADLGRPKFETEFLEVNGFLQDVNAAIKNFQEWAKPVVPPFDIKTFAMKPKAHKIAKGVVLAITPFNYPLWLVTAPLISALAAGNTVCLKVAENAAATAALWAELVPQYFDPDVVRVINGGIPETTRVLELQWDHISYTGGGAVGRIVATAAAKHLTPVTLELGGKSPVIVHPSCDLELTAKRVLLGRYTNAGQTCVAPDYILVVKSIQGKFLEAVEKAHKSFTDGDATTKPGSYSNMITERAYNRVKKLLESTRGKLIIGGEMDDAKKHIALTVVNDVPKDDSLMSEEIFGPILPIIPVEDVDEAIDIINEGDRPLAIYVFANDEKVKDKVRTETISGSMAFNEVVLQVANGYHTGRFGFDTFSHMRSEIDSPSLCVAFALSILRATN